VLHPWCRRLVRWCELFFPLSETPCESGAAHTAGPHAPRRARAARCPTPSPAPGRPPIRRIADMWYVQLCAATKSKTEDRAGDSRPRV
jgi:hypothetical protein